VSAPRLSPLTQCSLCAGAGPQARRGHVRRQGLQVPEREAARARVPPLPPRLLQRARDPRGPRVELPAPARPPQCAGWRAFLRSRALAGWRGEERKGKRGRGREGEKLTAPGRAAAVAQGRRSTRARPRRQCGGALTKTAGSPRPGRARAPGPEGAPIILKHSGTFGTF